jgi:hypothetical protein
MSQLRGWQKDETVLTSSRFPGLRPAQLEGADNFVSRVLGGFSSGMVSAALKKEVLTSRSRVIRLDWRLHIQSNGSGPDSSKHIINMGGIDEPQ